MEHKTEIRLVMFKKFFPLSSLVAETLLVVQYCSAIDGSKDDLNQRLWYQTVRFGRQLKEYVSADDVTEDDITEFDFKMTSLLMRAIAHEQEELRRRKLNLK